MKNMPSEHPVTDFYLKVFILNGFIFFHLHYTLQKTYSDDAGD